MDIKTPVIVTALYDIGRDKWDNFNLSYSTYLDWFKNTLALECEMVIFTDSKFVSTVLDYRREVDPDLSRSVLITTPIKELSVFKTRLIKMVGAMSCESFRKDIEHNVPEMLYPLYNVIMFNKLDFIKEAVDKKYFNGDLFIWADAGGLREDYANYKGVKWPSESGLNLLPSDKVTFFSHTKEISMDGGEKYRRFYAMSQIRQIQGTCFCVPSNMIDDLRVDFFHCVDACLDNKYIGSDEKIFDFAYLRNPKNYNLINCSWREYFDLLNPNTSECSKESPGVFEKAPGNGSSSGKNILIDLGSHRGEGLREILTNHLSIDADWEIHAFEPNPLIDPREYLDTLDCDVTFYRSAAWINDGSIEFDLYGEDGVSQGALIRETGGGKEYADFHGASFVECINFLDFLSQFDDSDNLFIKMDIEWSEYAILDKMLEAGWPYNIKKLWVEFHGKHQSEMQSKIHNLSNRIKDKGVVLEEWD